MTGEARNGATRSWSPGAPAPIGSTIVDQLLDAGAARDRACSTTSSAAGGTTWPVPWRRVG